MPYSIRTAIPPGTTSGPELADIVEEVGDLTQIVVLSDTTNQPGSPTEGDAYIVNGDASWGGAQYDIAVFRDAAWIYHTPEAGWVAYITDRGEARRFNGADWNSRIPDSSPEHATDGGTDAYASATNTDAPKDGDTIRRDFQSANTTTTPTLDTLTITTRDGSALWAGALSGVHELQLNAGGTAWLVLDPNPSQQRDVTRAATDTARGDVELATNAETQAGTDTGRAVTPAGAASTYARIATGTYTGDGSTSQSITGAGFQPKYLRIWPRETADATEMEIIETTDTIVDDNADGMAVQLNESGGAVAIQTKTNRILSLDSDGFTVDDQGNDSNPNANGVTYNYMAIG